MPQGKKPGGSELVYRVYFEPDNVEVQVEHGSNLLEVATSAGVAIAASCGGNGTCGSCAVRLKSGDVENGTSGALRPQDYDQGIRLACQSRVISDLIVEVMPGSRLENLIIKGETNELAASTPTIVPMVTGWQFKPLVSKIYLELEAPTAADNISDLSRLLRAVWTRYGLRVSLDLSLVRGLAHALRQANWMVTLTVLHYGDSHVVTKLEPGDTRSTNYALAIDMGTTAIRGQILDLNRGKVIAQGLSYNKQGRYGADVISRIAYASRGKGLEQLQQAAVTTINELMARLLYESSIPRSQINVAGIAANTVLVHLLLGLDPQYLRLAPYVPTISQIPPLIGSELGFDLDSDVYFYLFPSVSSYVGGDIVAGVLGAGIHQQDDLTLYIDLGTNGEMVLGSSEWMVSASCSAGPTFEGAGLKNGMIAITGAIEDFDIDPRTFEPTFTTIDGEPPRGICGSGVINITASLLKAGVIAPSGKFNADIPCSRIRPGEDGYEFVIAWGTQSATGTDIVITESDITNLIRAKAAIYAGYETMAARLGLTEKDLDRIIISGTFGNKLNIESAITIGLLPDLERDRFIFLGNGSLLGVRLGLFSRELISQAERLAQSITNLELSQSNEFMENFIASLFLPHTHWEKFPSVSAHLGGPTSKAKC